MDLTDKDYIKVLSKLMGESELTEISIEQEETKLTLKRELAQATVTQSVVSAVPEPVVQPQLAVAPTQPAKADSVAEAPVDDSLHYVTAPLVGTFYAAPAPDADNYVKVGDTVKKGQVLCIVEAMKLMNEIESDVNGTIVDILVDNAAPVEYGAKIFSIKPN